MKVISRLKEWIQELPERINQMDETELSSRPGPGKWSKKEILGHLCDSAHNNIQRFVRIQHEPQPYRVPKYAQEEWVKSMNYQSLPVSQILDTWVHLNKQITVILANTPENCFQYPCKISEERDVTLAWLVQDYVDHMEHHIKQMFHDL